MQIQCNLNTSYTNLPSYSSIMHTIYIFYVSFNAYFKDHLSILLGAFIIVPHDFFLPRVEVFKLAKPKF